MTRKHWFLILLALCAGAFSTAALSQARKQWRPATMQDVERQQARTGTQSATPAINARTEYAQPPSQQAYIDPRTGQLISRPATASPAVPATATRHAAAFTLQRTTDGFLYIDTSEHRHLQTVVIHAGGTLSKRCSIWSPWSDPTNAIAAGPPVSAESADLSKLPH